MKSIFLGPPGAGKGTVAKKIAEDWGYAHISTGDIFRKAIKEETALGKKIKDILASGELVPDKLTSDLIKDYLDHTPSTASFILDGFPRTIPQADALEGFATIDLVLNFVLSDQKIIRRLSGRRTCKQCGATFHILFMPPRQEGICDICGGELFIRKDDEEESIRNRLSVYKKQTEPLIQYYRDKKRLKDIDASPPPEQVLIAVKLQMRETR